MMRKFLVALMALLTVAAQMMPSVASAAGGVAHWRHYGADPAYASKAAAKADAVNVFARAGWPPEVARVMHQKMMTEAPERITLKKGDRLDFMRSGARELWRNVLVDFVSHGRGINITADADQWTLSMGGVTYKAIIPDVCNNLAGKKEGTPEEPCVWLLVPGKPGGKVSVEVTRPYVDTDDCKLGYTGPGKGADGRSFNPNGYRPITMDVAHPCDWTAVNAYFRKEPSVTGCVPVGDGWYAIRLNRSVLTNPDILVILCLTLADGRTTLSVDVHHDDYVAVGNGVYIATVWASEREVRADYQGQTYLWWEFDHGRAQALMQLTDRRR